MSTKKAAIVITTIQAPTPCVLKWIGHSQAAGAPIIVMGDSIGPHSYHPHCDFYSLDRQRGMPFTLAGLLPVRHYSRKNLGYLAAAAQGTEIIYETDDDNLPLEHWTVRDSSQVACSVVDRPGWVNSFRYYTQEKIWPRGLPLDEILAPLPPLSSGHVRYSPIQQGLASGEPDVDAIWRLVYDQRVDLRVGPTLFMSAGCWTPFNSQSTWWHAEAFPLLYLPSHCSFRMTDIWRSFVAQRCLWEMNAGLTIHPAEVEQFRNPHVIFADFRKEIDGYLKNREICARLADLSLRGTDPAAHIVQCYAELVAQGYFPPEEMPLVEAWARDVSAVLDAGHRKAA